jgi:hypothetical protein
MELAKLFNVKRRILLKVLKFVKLFTDSKTLLAQTGQGFIAICFIYPLQIDRCAHVLK